MTIRCHSSFVHYNMFHDGCRGGGNNYGSIFNITNNCSGGHTSFWGGLGAGLGFGLGNMFGGLFGNFMGGFGNMFGGFGNMFGLGGLMGGFGGWANPWGGGSNLGGGVDRDYSEYSSRRSKTSSGNEKLDDKDYDTLNDYHTKVNKLVEEARTANKDSDIDSLIKELKDYQLKDKNLDKENTDQITNLIEQLKAAKSKPETKSASEAGNDEVLIGNANKKISALKIEDLESLDDNAIRALTPEKAKAILNQLGYIDADGNTGKMSAKYKVLLLLEQAEVNVKCAQNTKSGLQDPFIQGKISGVTKTADDKITYTIDNSTVGNALYKFKYTFTQVDNVDNKPTFHLTKIDKNGSTKQAYIDNLWKNRNYILNNEQGPLSFNGPALVSKNSDNTRTKLENVLQ